MDATSIEAAARLASGAERALVRRAAEQRDHPVMRLVATVSEVGDQPQLRTLCGGVVAAGLMRGDARLARAGIKMLLAHELATMMKRFIKNRIDRTRPRSASNGKQARPTPGRSKSKEQTSFPSGHTAGSIAVAQAFASEYPQYALAARSLAGLVSVAQVPRCAHYPSDVAVGALIGVAAGAAVNWRGRPVA